MLLYRYALRNALLPVITTLGMIASSLLGANVLVEKVFAWPGLGSYALDSMASLDYAPLQGFVLVHERAVRADQRRRSTCSTASSTRACASDELGRRAAARVAR